MTMPSPDHMFDGGDLDCGSGLVLLIRENMLRTPVGGVLEMRSRERTVADDLPPWCRMVGHDYLGSQPGDGCTRYFMRRGQARVREEEQALAEDKNQARNYEWRLRIRATGHLKSTVYCRNFAWDSGQPASFEEKDAHPCGVEQLFGALGAALCSGYATECSMAGLEVDDIEITVRGRLHNVLAHLGLEDGDPAVSAIDIKCFASTLDDPALAEAAWNRAVSRSPVAATLAKATILNIKFSVV
jgi:TusA-related sulfurtransferase